MKYYLRINDHNLAAIDSLQCQHTGPTETFLSSIITLEDQKLLFEDYLTCIIADKQYILVNQISEKLCNLSFRSTEREIFLKINMFIYLCNTQKHHFYNSIILH